MSVPLCDVPGPAESADLYRRYDRSRLEFLRAAHNRYGDTFRFGANTLMTRDPAAVRHALISSNSDFIAEESLTDRRVDATKLQQAIDSWMTGRRASWPSFRRPDHATELARVQQSVVAVLTEYGTGPIDVFDAMTDVASRAIAAFCVGEDAAELHAAARRTTRAAVHLMDKSRVLPDWWPVGPGKKWKRHIAREEEVLTELITRRRPTHRSDGGDVLDRLIAAELPPKAIVHTLKGILGAAFGVPGTGLTWCLLMLSKDLAMRSQVAREYQGLVGDGAPAQTPVTTAFVKEVLRLYPPTWLMARHVLRPVELNTVSLPAGATVMFSPALIHTDDRWWQVPDLFKPERWLPPRDTTEAARAAHAYLPFGAGPRVCLGAQIGLVHMALALGVISTQFATTIVEVDETPVPAALLKPRTLRAQFVPR